MIGSPPSMADAMRLTRNGKLAQATDLIQALLSGTGPAATPAAASEPIDLVPVKVATSGPDAAAAKPARPPGASAGTFVERHHAGTAGTLDYRLYLPAGETAGMPLVVMLHGCTQTPEDFARGTGMNRLADELGVIVAYPRQTRSGNAQQCWNWFRPADQQRDRGEPALIAGIARQIVREDHADPRRVYVAGLSAGGAAAAIVAACYPELFAAVGIHSGLACDAAHDLPSALLAMKRGAGPGKARPPGRFVPTITFHGDRDTTVAEINSREIIAAAADRLGAPLHTSVETGQKDGGRRWTRAVSVDGAGDGLIEQWTVHGAGHAWSGGDGTGSYADPDGPDASREMLRFFLDHRLPAA